MSTQQLTLTDLQFTGNDLTSQKLRRLVQDLIVAEKAVNSLLNSVATLTENAATTSSTVFANPELQATYAVSGLAAGEVLQALTATSAAFAKLNLPQLGDVVIDEPSAGEVLTYSYGEWTNAPIPATSGGAKAENIGTGAGPFAGILGGTLAFKSIEGDGTTIQVETTTDTITVSYIGPTLGAAPAGVMGPPGMDGEPGEDGMMGPPGVGGGAVVTSGFTYQQAAALVSMRM